MTLPGGSSGFFQSHVAAANMVAGETSRNWLIEAGDGPADPVRFWPVLSIPAADGRSWWA